MNLRRSIQILARKTPRRLCHFVKRTVVAEPFILWLDPNLRSASSRAAGGEALGRLLALRAEGPRSAQGRWRRMAMSPRDGDHARLQFGNDALSFALRGLLDC